MEGVGTWSTQFSPESKEQLDTIAKNRVSLVENLSKPEHKTNGRFHA